MIINKNQIILQLFMIMLSVTVLAEDGMWPIYDLDKIPFDKMKQKGLELDKLEIYNPDGVSITNAIVNLSGGSSSFVSKYGLVLTNHHVAFGAIQKQSTTERNFVRDGFYAENYEDEIPAIGYVVNVIKSIENKTEEVLLAVNNNMTDKERYDTIEEVTKKIIKNAEEGKDVKCHLASMFGGKEYILYTFFRVRDVRIVYAPPHSIGSYGGDIDNWMWPRHCGDFAFVRAYVAPDGSSVEYADENVPYQPKNYLIISSKGVQDGDFTMMLGFPGRTNRYARASYIDYLQNKYYPLYIETSEDRLDILEEEASKDSSVALRLMSKKSGINNYLKKTYGINNGFNRIDAFSIKSEIDSKLNDFIKNNPTMNDKYGEVLDQIDSLYTDYHIDYKREFYLSYLTYAIDYLSLANRIYKWSVEKEKEDHDRDPGYQKRDIDRTKRRLKNAQINLVPSYDKRVLLYFIKHILNLPDNQRIDAIDKYFGREISEEEIKLKIDEMYSKTNIDNQFKRLNMFESSRIELEELNDPFLNFAKALRPELDKSQEEDEEFYGALNRLKPKLMMAHAERENWNLYPDANGTLRFNFGHVEGYSPADGIDFKYYTTLKGIFEKETGEDPFIVPEDLREIYRKQDYGNYYDSSIAGVPVNFVTTNSGTNGSSGSAVLNSKGELVGIDFDTGFEGVSADYIYNPDVCRAIVVDVRYMLFLIDKVYHLDKLMNELTIH